MVIRIKTFGAMAVLLLSLLLIPTTSFAEVSGWRVGLNNTVQGEIRQVTDEKYHGNASARIINETPQSPNNYLWLIKDWTAAENSRYRATYRIKSVNCTNTTLKVHADIWSGLMTEVNVSGSQDWREVTYTFDMPAGGGKQFTFLMEDVGTVWIDDFVLDRIDQSGTVIANVVTDEFESGIDLTPPANVTGATVIAEYDSINVSWINTPGSNFNGTYVYQVNDDQTLTLLARVPRTETGVKLTGLMPNTEYAIKIRSVDMTGNQSAGVDVLATTKTYNISAPVFMANGAPAVNLAEGTFNARVTVKNSASEPVKVSLILALFDGKKMVGLTQTATDVGITSASGQYIEAAITIPQLSGGNYRLNVYTWNDILAGKAFSVKTVRTP